MLSRLRIDSNIKVVYRLTSAIEYKTLETYLSKMAAKGFMVIKISNAFITFKKCVPVELDFNVGLFSNSMFGASRNIIAILISKYLRRIDIKPIVSMLIFSSVIGVFVCVSLSLYIVMSLTSINNSVEIVQKEEPGRYTLTLEEKEYYENRNDRTPVSINPDHFVNEIIIDGLDVDQVFVVEHEFTDLIIKKGKRIIIIESSYDLLDEEIIKIYKETLEL